MCGIVGVVGKIDKTARAVFEQMLIVDSLRGSDSTGFVSCKGTEATVFKMAGDPYFVKENKGYDRTLIKAANVLIGHNRYATQGKVNRANAHPFEFPNVVGVHNGTLTNKYALPDGHVFEVDSEALYNAIDTIGVDAAVGKALGAWSLVWYNKKDKTVNLLRNEERPMSVCYSEDKKTLFFASEAHMLQWILVRNGVKHTPIQITNINTLLTLPVKDEWEGTATELADFAARPVVGAVKPVFQQALPARGNGGVVDISKAANFLNTTITFYTDGTMYIDGCHYVRGEFFYKQQSYTVLVPTGKDATLTDFLLDDDHEKGYLTFSGIVRSIRNNLGSQYLILDKASIKGEELLKKSGQSSSKKPPAQPKFVGFGGQELTMPEWRDITACGCIICQHYPLVDEVDSLKWVSKFSFVCGNCQH